MRILRHSKIAVTIEIYAEVPGQAADRNNLRVTRVHHLRHTTTSLLKNLHVPPGDAQMFLGHCSHLDHDADLHARRRGSPKRRSHRARQGARQWPATGQLWSETVVSSRFQDLREGVLPGGAKGT
jgi:hypothetical protein